VPTIEGRPPGIDAASSCAVEYQCISGGFPCRESPYVPWDRWFAVPAACLYRYLGRCMKFLKNDFAGSNARGRSPGRSGRIRGDAPRRNGRARTRARAGVPGPWPARRWWRCAASSWRRARAPSASTRCAPGPASSCSCARVAATRSLLVRVPCHHAAGSLTEGSAMTR
jgi:hypothetical protein